MSNRTRRIQTTYLTGLTALMGLSAALATAMASWLDAAGRRTHRDEAGNVITDNLAWIVFGVVAIVAIGALLQALGSNVVAWVTKQLGI